MKTNVIKSTLIIISLILLLSCSKKEDNQLKGNIITDLVGYKSNITSNINRIILPRSKDIYSLMVVLGDELPNKLVAWGPDLKQDDRQLYDALIKKYPKLDTIPVTGNIYTDSIDVEQIIHLKPDVVIMDKFMINNGYKFVDIMKRLNIPMIFLDGSSDPLYGPQQGLLLLGKILNKKDRAQEIVNYIDEQINYINNRIDNIIGPSVYLEQGYLGPTSFADTYSSKDKTSVSWGKILECLKVHNIADGVIIGQTPIDPEYVLFSNPDYIVITGQGWKNIESHKLGYNIDKDISRKCLSAYKNRIGWSNLKAVKNNNLTSVFHNSSSILTFASFQYLAKAFYKEKFTTIEPEKNLENFFINFMPIPYKGTWFYTLN